MHPSDTLNARRSLTLLFSSILMGSAIAPSIPPVLYPIAQAAPIAQSVTNAASPPRSVIAAIRRDVSRKFGVMRVNVVSFSAQSWPDACLGLPQGKEGCAEVIVPGWRVEVSDGLQTWFYRTDQTGQVLRLENADRPVLPQQVARSLIQQVARDTGIATNTLKISEVKAAEFEGCMGIYRPNQACTMIAIPGWKAIITSPQQSFVYHLSQDASRIAQNDTASGAGSTVRVSFESFDNIPVPESKVIFQSVLSGGFTGEVTTIKLTDDGNVTEWRVGPTIRSQPVVRKTLTPEQIAQFKQILETQRFPNFHGLSYLTSAAVADYPTTIYQTPYVAMQFIDLEKQSLPRSLQAIIGEWERLIQ